MAQRGGKRAGAGRKPGSKNKLTQANKATLTDLALSYAEDAIQTLHAVATDKGQSGPARVSAANSILDRALGKPIQSVEHTGEGGEPVPFTGFLIERAKPDPAEPD